MNDATNLNPAPEMLNHCVASVERKVLSSYGWCSHFIGEPVAYAIIKEQRGVNPSSELEQVRRNVRPAAFSQHPPRPSHDRWPWAKTDDTERSPSCQVILSFLVSSP